MKVVAAGERLESEGVKRRFGAVKLWNQLWIYALRNPGASKVAGTFHSNRLLTQSWLITPDIYDEILAL